MVAKNPYQILKDEAKILTANAEIIQISAERIIKSCYTPGTNGSVHKNLLHDKANEFKKLARLHNSVAKRLLVAACKLKNDTPEDEVLAEVRIYNIFFCRPTKTRRNRG